MPLRRRDALALVLVVVALVWLGRARPTALSPPPLAAAAEPSARAPAPAFELAGVDGGAFASAADGRGRVLVVNFWATWCAPCRDELPALAALHAGLAADGVLVVAVSVDARPDAAARFAAARALPFPVLADPDEALARRYGAFAYPTTVVVDRTGRVALRAVGAFAWDAPAAAAWLRALAAEPGPDPPP